MKNNNHGTPDDVQRVVDEFQRLFDSPEKKRIVLIAPREWSIESEDIPYVVGRDAFERLHEFHWKDHQWSESIPVLGFLEDYEALVEREHPELLRKGCRVLV